MILLMYKNVYFNTNNFDHVMHSIVVSLLHDFEDVFPKDISSGLPPLKEIEHSIDLVPMAAIPNRPSSYRSNPEEMKEL